MNKPLSIYLDLMRVCAALSVLLFHSAADNFGGAWLRPAFGHLGTQGVIVFFVLSGFVISYVADGKEDDFKTFMLSRFARLWSVVLPALLLTVVADAIGRNFDASFYPAWYPTSVLIGAAKLGASALFINQIWFLGPIPLSNAPFWSLSYEFWYYVCFGAFVLIRGKAGKLLALAAFVLMGPKIWLLFPIWLMGSLTFRALWLAKRTPAPAAVLLFLAPAAAYWLSSLSFLGQITELVNAMFGSHSLGFSDAFASNTVLGVCISMNIFGMAALSERLAPALVLVEKPVRWLAGATLSIYLFHIPLLYMFGAIFKPTADAWAINLLSLVSTLTLAIGLSTVTEAKKHLVRNLLSRALQQPLQSSRSG
jgi:peptidoglycan/LPS O-acetylase OafA/YrhL